MSAIRFIGNAGQPYVTRGATYTADANGILLVNTPSMHDIVDLLNMGAVPAGMVGNQTQVGAARFFTQLSTPAAPTVTPTGGSATSYSYKVVALFGAGTTAASAAGSTSAGGATLSATVYNTLAWTAVAEATGYNVYRTVGGATQGLIATVAAGTLTLVDTGLAGDGTTAPTLNSTNVSSGLWQPPVQILSADGAITSFGAVLITKGTAAAITLGLPIAGAPGTGQDGLALWITDTTGAAHTVTTPTNGIAATGVAGNKHVLTFGGTANSQAMLRAYNGIWVPENLGGGALS